MPLYPTRGGRGRQWVNRWMEIPRNKDAIQISQILNPYSFGITHHLPISSNQLHFHSACTQQRPNSRLGFHHLHLSSSSNNTNSNSWQQFKRNLAKYIQQVLTGWNEHDETFLQIQKRILNGTFQENHILHLPHWISRSMAQQYRKWFLHLMNFRNRKDARNRGEWWAALWSAWQQSSNESSSSVWAQGILF